jgi:hypothetical protein
MQDSLFKNPPTNQNFSDFEKEALGEVVLKTVESDLQQYLRKFHLQQMKDLEERMAGLEKRCQQGIQESIEKNIKLQLEEHFQKVVEACQKDITQMSSPLFKRAEKDVQSLTDVVTKANAFCENIQNQYALRWSTPFFALVGTAALTGALMGLFLLFSQVPFISVLFMNPQIRETYLTGRNAIEAKEEQEAQAAQAASMPQLTPQEQEVQKSPKTPKPNPPQKQKKKKRSK